MSSGAEPAGGYSRALVDISALRSEFPVLEHCAYMNAGTDGPLATSAVRAGREELERELREGRTGAHFERRFALGAELRHAYAATLTCDPADLSLTTCTSEGIAQTMCGLRFAPGDEILTSDEEHPGVLGALGAARELHGVVIREVPLSRIAEEVRPSTALVACCHVGWETGLLAPAELREVEPPVLLDGAQGAGAIALDVDELGCDAYAAAGQKWLCGPDGTGMLYTSPPLRERLAVERRGYANLADPGAGVDAGLHPDGRALDAPSLSAETLAISLAAAQLLERAGWEQVYERAVGLASQLAEMLARQGREVAPRGPSTLVSFRSDDPPTERARLAERGVVLRNIPGRPWLRASVGAWNDEHDLERLLAALAP